MEYEFKKCEDCLYGQLERVVGNGITEPPYVWLIRCPYNDYYKYPDDYCNTEHYTIKQ